MQPVVKCGLGSDNATHKLVAERPFLAAENVMNAKAGLEIQRIASPHPSAQTRFRTGSYMLIPSDKLLVSLAPLVRSAALLDDQVEVRIGAYGLNFR